MAFSYAEKQIIMDEINSMSFSGGLVTWNCLVLANIGSGTAGSSNTSDYFSPSQLSSGQKFNVCTARYELSQFCNSLISKI